MGVPFGVTVNDLEWARGRVSTPSGSAQIYVSSALVSLYTSRIRFVLHADS